MIRRAIFERRMTLHWHENGVFFSKEKDVEKVDRYMSNAVILLNLFLTQAPSEIHGGNR